MNLLHATMCRIRRRCAKAAGGEFARRLIALVDPAVGLFYGDPRDVRDKVAGFDGRRLQYKNDRCPAFYNSIFSSDKSKQGFMPDHAKTTDERFSPKAARTGNDGCCFAAVYIIWRWDLRAFAAL